MNKAMFMKKRTYSLSKEVGSFPRSGFSSISTGQNSSLLSDLETHLAEAPVSRLQNKKKLSHILYEIYTSSCNASDPKLCTK